MASGTLRLLALCAASVAQLGGLSPAVLGQTLEGRVIDAGSAESIPGVALILRNERGSVEARGETDQDGGFVLAARRSGSYTLEAARLGYAPLPAEPVSLEQEVLEVEILLSRSPIELDPLTVIGRRHDARGDDTFEGALARHRIFPRMGSRRVVLRSDPEFRASMVVTDILRWFPPRRGCTIVYSGGFLARTPEAATEWLEKVSTEDMEAVEFYRFWEDAPIDLKDVPSYIERPSTCSVVALWPRISGPPPRGLTWGRALRAVGVLGTITLLGSLLSGR
jgi:hypothetical protein